MGSQPCAYPWDAQLAGNIFLLAQQLLTDSLSGETEDQTSLISDPHAATEQGSVFRARGSEIIHVALIVALPLQETVSCLGPSV